jgi:hypothetical protein
MHYYLRNFQVEHSSTSGLLHTRTEPRKFHNERQMMIPELILNHLFITAHSNSDSTSCSDRLPRRTIPTRYFDLYDEVIDGPITVLMFQEEPSLAKIVLLIFLGLTLVMFYCLSSMHSGVDVETLTASISLFMALPPFLIHTLTKENKSLPKPRISYKQCMYWWLASFPLSLTAEIYSCRVFPFLSSSLFLCFVPVILSFVPYDLPVASHGIYRTILHCVSNPYIAHTYASPC